MMLAMMSTSTPGPAMEALFGRNFIYYLLLVLSVYLYARFGRKLTWPGATGLGSSGKDENTIVYNGVATIAKKRLAVSNLLSTPFVDPGAALEDEAFDLEGQKIEIQLVSVDLDPGTKSPKLSGWSKLEGWRINPEDPVADDEEHQIHFKVPTNFGEIGAFVIRNKHRNEFYLKSLVLEGPDKSKVLFNTLSWIYRHGRYAKDRAFFASKKYVTAETPEGLKALREQELEQTRGNGKGRREAWDRIYDYDVYNDYGHPDRDIALKRPVLGGKETPYPRRNRTGRPKSKADPNSESRLTSYWFQVPYIPSDEFFVRTKNSSFIANFLMGVLHSLLPKLKAHFENEQNFKDIDEIHKLYKNGNQIPSGEVRQLHENGNQIHTPSSMFGSGFSLDLSRWRGSSDSTPNGSGRRGSANSTPDLSGQTRKWLVLDSSADSTPDHSDQRGSSDSTPDLSDRKGSMVDSSQSSAPKGNDRNVVVYPVLEIVKSDAKAWLREEEFARHTVAGLHPTVYKAVTGNDQSVFGYPLPEIVKSNATAWLRDEEFGRQTLAGLNPAVIKALTEYPPKGETALTDDHILPYLEGFSVAKAIQKKKLFTIDYRDILLDLVAMANADTKTGFKCYAPRAIFFHTNDGKMMPVAIELSLPSNEKRAKTVNRVFTPADDADHLWRLAKIHFGAVDSNYHQVYSHFTETHAVMEPFIIATRRQISALHPVFPLLVPHFKDTLNINSAAREILISATGVIENSFTFGPNAMLVGAKVYGESWRFDHLSPPRDLVARGMAVPAAGSHPGGVKLVVEDYPMARDSLDLWDALYKWALSYLNIVYKGSDDAVKNDKEIQAWWNEIINVGHADHKDAPWWPKIDSIKSLADIVASIAFVAGPLHASVNFGQWAYGGYILNKPTGTRRLIPEKGSDDFKALQQNPEEFLLSTISSPSQALTVMTVLEMLATHSPDEEYIGSQSLAFDFHANPELAAAFQKFSDSIKKVEADIQARNKDKSLRNRFGPAEIPYTLLEPTSDPGLTGKGVPYSISI